MRQRRPAAGTVARGTPFRVLCAAGGDSSGCAGIAADLRTVAALGGHGMPALTAVTAQDTRGVRAIGPVAPRLVRAQIEGALADPGVDAVKIGMLATAAVVRAVASALGGRGRAPVVLDPVLRSTTGGELLDAGGRRALIGRLLPLVDLLTPNLPEAASLLGRPVGTSVAAMCAAAEELRALGAGAVLLKGGHRRGDAVDVFCDASGTTVLRAPRVAAKNTRGTGCVLSTACACFLAEGLALPEAVRRAKDFVTAAIRCAYPLGKGRGPVDPTTAAGGNCGRVGA
jgi:hydroxymethylpyrimidine/phosphomethylpyrimidine kinase